ncbi:hypothetical protein CH063_06552 [Colletotrichum higginsianum]|uniref:FAD-binding FR-type domain-containing protein n=1 Tax=Colletotrichum higginsianum (strain IMI 349063) TaxID=759273 RepID=H1V2Y4_COLHI|nr:hypothetical protein CH063_06552 [Colletotrichum higginsianum]
MNWHYRFYEHTEAGNRASLEMLARYGGYVQLSTIVPIVMILAARAALQLWEALSSKIRHTSYENVVCSEEIKVEERTSDANMNPYFPIIRRLKWWFGHEQSIAGCNCGTRGQLVVGGTSVAWILCLCFLETGDNYNHLTKRFAMLAVALFPVQFSLSMRYANPVALALGSSHVELNQWHGLLGCIIQALLTCHAALYINKYIQLGVLSDAFRFPVVITGFAGFLGLSTLSLSSTAVVRRYSHRLFFITHVLLAFALPVLVFFHVNPARIYMAQALGIFLLDRGLRKWLAFTAQASLHLVPGTDLIRITITAPSKLARLLQRHPGSYVYVAIPPESRPVPNHPIAMLNLAFKFIDNPFTVAAVNEASCELTLIVRKRNGPMTRHLGSLAANCSRESSRCGETFPIRIEGPHRTARQFNNVLVRGGFDRVLIFAGGIGATFTLPVYQHILQENPQARVDMFWALRCASDAAWATTASEMQESVLKDERIHIFITREQQAKEEEGEALEDTSRRCRTRQTLSGVRYTLQRPNLKSIVDGAFQDHPEDRVAILVCGPLALKRELREQIDPWVKRGRHVWWQYETFSS